MEGQQTDSTAGIDPAAVQTDATARMKAATATEASGNDVTAWADRAVGASFGVDAMTGTSDPIYDLVSVLYHALQGAEASMIYAGDAAYGDDTELAQFFEEIQDQDCKRAERAKQLLRRYLNEQP